MKTHRAIKRMLAADRLRVGVVTGAMAQDRQFNIPAGDLKAALDAYIAQTGDQLIFRPQDVTGRRTQGVSGTSPRRMRCSGFSLGRAFRSIATLPERR